MQAPELLELFNKYYECPERSWTELFHGLTNYSFEDYEVFLAGMVQLKPRCKGYVPLEWQKSNSQMRYLFGPPSVKGDVESFLRFAGSTNSYILIKDYKTYLEEGTVLSIPDIWHNWQQVADFIRKQSLTPCYIYGRPHYLNQMTANEDFLDNMADVIDGFVNTDLPAFCKTSILPKYDIHFNDQMINWKTGVNFYNCSAGHRHFLPIFLHHEGQCHNLLNIINRMDTKFGFEDDDLFRQTGPFELCECGKRRCQSDLLPHSHNFLTGKDYNDLMTLRNSLASRYRWIQFVEREGIEVLYETSERDMSSEDRDLILEKLPEATFKRGETLKIWTKMPCFWRI